MRRMFSIYLSLYLVLSIIIATSIYWIIYELGQGTHINSYIIIIHTYIITLDRICIDQSFCKTSLNTQIQDTIGLTIIVLTNQEVKIRG